MKRIWIIVTVVIALQHPQYTKAQAPTQLTADSLDCYIRKAMDMWQIPGVAVCILKDGKLFYQKGFGLANTVTKQPVDEQTVFPIASVSKTFTGTLYATLEAEKKLSLNDAVKKWWPALSVKDKLYEQQISFADILSHRTGWKTFQGDLLNTESSLDYPVMIQKFGNQAPAYPIRTRFGYSNFGFMIAGQCVQPITGTNWNNYLHQRLLQPLGMKRTLVFAPTIEADKNVAVGHSFMYDSLVALINIKVEPYAHGGIYASIADLGVWTTVLLNKGRLQTEQVIPESAITKMWQSHTIIGRQRSADREFYFKTYGLGWEIVQYQNAEVMQHSGAYAGALASLALIPKLNLGIVILTNSDGHFLQETLKWQVIDAFLQKPAPDYTQAAIERRRKILTDTINVSAKQVATAFAVDLKAIVGVYECSNYGKAFIKQEGGKYVLLLEHHPQLKGLLSPYQKDQLSCVYNHPMFGKVLLPFVLKHGLVKSFTLYVDAFVEADGYEFIKVK